MRISDFRTGAVFAAAMLCGMLNAGVASAQRPHLPPAGDCRAMAASGAKNIWYGQFTGRYEDPVFDERVYPLSARGCFPSEYLCRRWLNQLLTISGGYSALMSCRPYRQRY
ncbi:MAG TPA: hypothetical protein VK862_16535 [Afifellaceae bacterium]|nr:hypothetical protein [Afifellaceae bacterium]